MHRRRPGDRGLQTLSSAIVLDGGVDRDLHPNRPALIGCRHLGLSHRRHVRRDPGGGLSVRVSSQQGGDLVVSKRTPVWLLSPLIAIGLTALVASPAGARPAAKAQTFTVHLDAQAHNGEPWAFLKIFPDAIQVHSGDVIHAAWAGTDTPHTATFVNTSDPEGWRAQNQGPGGPFEVSVPDSQIGGDDQENVVNPSVLFPAPPGCGDPTPCTFDGSSIVSSGVRFPSPAGFLVTVAAPVGSYSLLC